MAAAFDVAMLCTVGKKQFLQNNVVNFMFT